MTKNLLRAALPLFALFLFISSADAQKKIEVREVGDFTKFDLNISADVYLTQGDKESLTLEGDESILKKIKTEVSNGTLTIKSKKRNSWNWGWGNSDLESIKVYVTMKNVEGISLSGSGDIVSKNAIAVKDLDISLGGSGDIKLQLAAEKLEVSLAGSGGISLSGSAKNCEISIAGSGNVNAKNLNTTICEVSIAGSGDCEIGVSEKLEASIAGSGDIRYNGNPKVQTSIIGSGKVSGM